MNKIEFTYPGGLKKALTLSYDDGVYQDIRLVKIFNKYKLKATFNVNSGVPAGTKWSSNGVDIIRMNLKDTTTLYDNHEVAIHTLTHPDLVKLNKEEIINEVLEDKKNLEKIYNTDVRGMAYPFGTYNDEVVSIVNELGICYSRTVKDTYNFSLPENFLKWHPTCRHDIPKLMDLARNFVEDKSDELKLFYLWGHSYEFDIKDNWDIIESFSKYISDRSDIWYASNIEIFDYITAMRLVQIDEEEKLIINKSNINIYAEIDKRLVIIESGDSLSFNE